MPYGDPRAYLDDQTQLRYPQVISKEGVPWEEMYSRSLFSRLEGRPESEDKLSRLASFAPTQLSMPELFRAIQQMKAGGGGPGPVGPGPSGPVPWNDFPGRQPSPMAADPRMPMGFVPGADPRLMRQQPRPMGPQASFPGRRPSMAEFMALMLQQQPYSSAY